MRGENRAWAIEAALHTRLADNPLLLTIFEDAGVWAMILRADGLIEAASEVAAVMFGKTLDEVVGRRLQEVIDPETAMERIGFIRHTIDSGSLVTVDSVLGGRLRRTYLRPFPVDPGAGDRASRVLAVCRPRPMNGTKATFEAVHNDYGKLQGLTDREIAVLTLIAKGYTTSRIAKELHRSIKTIEWHRVSLGNKLGVKNRVELARFAISVGLAEVDAEA